MEVDDDMYTAESAHIIGMMARKGGMIIDMCTHQVIKEAIIPVSNPPIARPDRVPNTEYRIQNTQHNTYYSVLYSANRQSSGNRGGQ